MTITEIYSQRATLQAELDGLLAHGDDVTEDQLARAERIVDTEFPALDRRHDVLKKCDAEKAERNRAVGVIAGQEDIGVDVLDRRADHGAPCEDRSWKGMFGAPSDGGGFKNVEEFLRAIHSGRADSRLDTLRDRALAMMHDERATMTGDQAPSDGGFAVPDEFAAKWLDDSLESEVVRPRATVWPMASATRKVVGTDGSDHTSNLFGGIVAYWTAEAGSITETEPKLRLVELNARGLKCLSSTSNEVLADGMGLGEQLGSKLTKAIGWYFDDACLNGDGAGKPLGVFNDPALVTVAKETGQAATTIVYQNLTKMFARLHPACLQRSAWVCNATAIPQLLELSIAVGTGGSVVPVLSESGGKFKMLTRPVVFTEKASALGSVGDISLVDFSQYAIGLRKEVSLDTSSHAGFATDVTYYRAVIRVDGQGTWKEAITPKNGDTLSWAVTLAERA